MKKMLSAVIFIIILAMLVFAGCIRFTTSFPDTNTTDGGEPVVSEDMTYEPVTHYVPATDNFGEPVTDVEGETILIPVTEEPATVYPDYPSSYEPTSVDAYQPGTQGGEPASSGYVPATSSPYVPTTSVHGSEPTTSRGGSDVPTTSPVKPTSKNEYDIFRSGSFYLKGTMSDSEGTNPLEMAITPNTIYMLTQFDANTEMAILVSDGTTYLIYPAGKAYLEMSSAVMKIIGLDVDELISSDDLGFSAMKPLSAASRTSKATMDGQDCTIYEFNQEDGSISKVYLNGNKLVAVENYSGGKLASATHITLITDDIPAEKINPTASYKKTGIFDFMSMLPME